MIRASGSRVLSRVSRRLGILLALVACGDRRPPLPEDPAATVDGVRWPAIVDSHVHVTYWPVADKLAASGVATVVDLSAPESALGTTSPSPINVIASGPMLTRPDGYPLDSWGADGYGIACADATCVTQTIDRMASKGARVVKIALGDNGLPAALVPGAVKHAHARQLKVAVHALDNASAMLAATAGADLLAHTPAERLEPATIAAWKSGAVISTLAAFGAPAAVDNLRALRAAGCTILYGTDLGNLRDAGPSTEEIGLLRQAGLDDAAITAAMTTTPATYWKLPETSYLLLEGDPTKDVRALLSPRGIWIRGRRIK